jgi:hypothetical protein
MKKLMKKNEIRPGSLLVITGFATMAGALSMHVGFEQVGHTAGDFVRSLFQCDCVSAAGG